MKENDKVRVGLTGITGIVTVVGVHEGGREDLIEVLKDDGEYELFAAEQLEFA